MFESKTKMDRLKDCRISIRDRFRIKPIIYTQNSQ